MRVIIGSDHGGYDAKQIVIEYLTENQIDFIDVGCYSKDSCDYPEFGIKVGEIVKEKEGDFGIVICTTGIGISIAANKVKGIRAALCFNEKVAMMTRLHNDANVLALPGAYLNKEEIISIVKNFLETKFEGGRHLRRVDIINSYDNR